MQRNFQFVTTDFFPKTLWPIKYIINLHKVGSESSGRGVGNLWPIGPVQFSTSLCVFHILSMPFFFFFLNKFIYFYFWLCWVFVSGLGLSLVAASGGHSSLRCAGLSLSWPLLWSTGSRRAGSVVVAHGLRCSAACGIFPDQGSNQCPLHWQADSQPLRHQGSPLSMLLKNIFRWLEKNQKNSNS